MKIESYKIELSNIHLYAYHGVLPQENRVGAWYTINLLLAIDNFESIGSDNLAATVNYAEIYDVVCEEMKKNSKLLEHVCGRIADKLFDRFPLVSAVEISLKKDTPPIGGDGLGCSVKLKAVR